MNNVENIGLHILEMFSEKQNYENKYNDILFSFITKAYELVNLSDDLYQVEDNIKLNKISLKDYILNSDVCNVLRENNVKNYSISELREYMAVYKEQDIGDVYSYEFALDLYEKLEDLESVENNKIDYEIMELSKILDNISNIRILEKNLFQDLYNSILLDAKEKYLDNNVIDDKLYNYIVQILNDIFNYYLYGNKEIPLENDNVS